MQKLGGMPEHIADKVRYLVLGEINVKSAHYLKRPLKGVEQAIARCRGFKRDARQGKKIAKR